MALVKLYQINGANDIQKDVEALKTSYDASKVITDIIKVAQDGDNPEVKYNVNEALANLQQEINVINGVDGEEGAMSLTEIKQAIENLKDKQIADKVRVTLKYSGTEVEEKEGFVFSTNIPEGDASVALPVYTLDNSVIYDENGDQITYSFQTNELSGEPHKLNVEASKESDDPVYDKIVEAFEFKVFPTGTWTIATLPKNALLDNEEMQLAAYDRAIDKIVIQIAKDKDVMDAIAEKVGDTAVQDAIEEAIEGKIDKDSIATELHKAERDEDDPEDTVIASDEKVVSEKALVDALALKLDAAVYESDKADLLNVDDVTDTISALEDAVDTLIPTEKAVATELATKVNVSDIVSAFDNESPSAHKVASEVGVVNALAAIDADRKNVEQNISDRISALEGIVAPVSEKFNWDEDDDKADKQFKLAQTPNGAIVKMYVNHLTYFENEDFVVNRTSKLATWTSNDFDVVDGDAIRFEYYTGDIVSNTGTITILHQDTLPSVGTFKIGDKVYRLTVATGENVGWICTKAGEGSAAEWTEFGIVDFDHTIYIEESED